ncbi:hypothetical protein [Nonomuraea dietziae]|uniref:hypothetical protein n=1 Tax=Nonomuraea dietziae TaxID=65515 RepID=UPI003405F197
MTPEHDPTARPDTSGCVSLLMAAAAGIYGLWHLAAGHPGVGAWALACAWLSMVLAAKTRELSELRRDAKERR